jgi:glycosyltransferase involved in cell wall biosynthesis
MRTVTLIRHENYTHEGINYARGEARTVSEEVAEILLATCYFRTSSNSSELIGISKRDGVIGAEPLNTIGSDDLNGKRILLRRDGGVGDCVFVGVVAQQLKTLFPDCHISLAIPPKLIHFIASFDAVDSVITVSESTETNIVYSYDYIIHFNRVLGSENKFTLDDRDYYVAHWERVGLPVPVEKPLPRLEVTRLLDRADSQEKSNILLRSCGFGEEPYVVVLLGSSNPLKRIHLDPLTNIVHALSGPKASTDKNPQLRVLCLGDEHDRHLKLDTPRVATSTDQDIHVSAELVRRATCVIGGDTGLLHFAAAIGVPTVSLWGPTDPELSMPYYGPSQEAHITLAAKGKCNKLPCKRLKTAFCPNFSGDFPICMRGIDVDAVVKSVYKLVGKFPTNEASSTRSSLAPYIDPRYINVAILMDNTDKYTGGGFFAWQLAKAYALRKTHKVYVYTDSDSIIYAKDDPNIPGLNIIRISDFDKWKGAHYPFDIIIGTPPFLGNVAVEAANKNDRAKSALLLYETPNYIATFRDGLDGKEEYWSGYKKALLECDLIMPISQVVKAAMHEWDEQFKDKRSFVTWPCVASNIADPILGSVKSRSSNERLNRIVMISRNTGYKELRNTMKVLVEDVAIPYIRLTPEVNNIELHIIGDHTQVLQKYVKELWGQNGVTVEFHENLSEEDKWNLLKTTKVLVHPSTFEGFGIPLAEAMYAAVPIVAHPLPVFHDVFKDRLHYYSEEDELCKEVTAVLDEWQYIDRSKLEEDVEEEEFEFLGLLDTAAWYAHRMFPITTLSSKTSLIAKKVWPHLLGEKQTAFVADQQASCRHLRIAYITPWGNRCGIAETTRQITDELSCTYHIFAPNEDEKTKMIVPDDDRVTRCWERAFNRTSSLFEEVVGFGPHVVHIEHEHSLFRDNANFLNFIQSLKSRGIKVVVTQHTFVSCKFLDDLHGMADVVIHTKKHDLGETDNAEFIHLPVTPVGRIIESAARTALDLPLQAPVVGSFGMWEEHKGYKEFLETYSEVSSIVGDELRYIIFGCHHHKSQYHAGVRRRFLELINIKRVILNTDYAPINEVIEFLSSCNVLVFNYSIASHSSASAAIRTGMSVGRPIVCTHSPMFSEFIHEEHVLKVPFGDPIALSEAIQRLLQDKDLAKKLVANCDKYIEDHKPQSVAQRHEELYQKLTCDITNTVVEEDIEDEEVVEED